MRTTSWVLLTVALAGLAAGGDGKPAAKALRVLSYNIHHGEGTDGKLDLARIAGVIKAANADLVAVQEVDRNAKRTGGVDQAKELARLTGLNAEFARAIPLQGGEYGQVILSRFPLKGVRKHELPGKEGQERRIVIEARVEPPGRPALTFLGTHFQHDDAMTRERQAAKVNDLFGQAAGPIILAGDLNAAPGSPPIKALQKEWAFATPPGGRGLLTIPSDVPRRQIDYILFRPADRFRVVEARVIEEKVASDHRPVLAVLEWAGP